MNSKIREAMLMEWKTARFEVWKIYGKKRMVMDCLKNSIREQHKPDNEYCLELLLLTSAVKSVTMMYDLYCGRVFTTLPAPPSI
jgi:hypothetical protein